MPNCTIQTLLHSFILLCWAVSVNAVESHEQPDQAVFVTDIAGNPVADAVVWLAIAEEPAQHPDKSAAIVVDQMDKQFLPQLSVIRVGDEVIFPNSDSVSHHVYSFSQPNSFELPLYRGGETPRVRFEHAGIVTLGCNIHDAMLGYILVLDTTEFAITDKDGVARFYHLPAADVDIQIWSPRLDAKKALLAERIESVTALLSVRAPLRLQPQPGVSDGSLAWEDY
jgi:plastocyanin